MEHTGRHGVESKEGTLRQTGAHATPVMQGLLTNPSRFCYCHPPLFDSAARHRCQVDPQVLCRLLRQALLSPTARLGLGLQSQHRPGDAGSLFERTGSGLGGLLARLLCTGLDPAGRRQQCVRVTVRVVCVQRGRWPMVLNGP